MASLQEVLELCRLCLIKDDVNTPIFEDADDISHVFLKLSACLPIKVSRDDLLPKRICESCFYKLELFYEFLKTCTTSEKQLLSWINPLKISTIPLSKSGSTILLKQEVPELIETDDLNIPSETQDYELQQPYEGVEFEFQQEEFIENESGTNVNEASGEKRKRGVTLETLQDDLDSDDDIRVHSSKHAKTEDDIDSDNDAEETFDEIPSTSGDNDQPGPSGVGKAGTDPPNTKAKLTLKTISTLKKINTKPTTPAMPQQTMYYIYNKDNLDVLKRKQEMVRLGYRNPFKYNKDRKQKVAKEVNTTCLICNKILEDKQSLIEHYTMHKNENENGSKEVPSDPDTRYMKCNACSQEFTSLKLYKKHLQSQHDDNSHTCEKCDRRFNGFFQLNMHHHNNHFPADGTFRCLACNFTCIYMNAFKSHIEGHEQYVCDICDQKFLTTILFEIHKSLHTSATLNNCEICNVTFPCSQFLDAHKKSYHPQGYSNDLLQNQCTICKQSFATKKSLNMHKRTHIEEKAVLCDICGICLVSRSHLKEHMHQHNGQKPYACTSCEKVFARKTSLKVHKRIHTGEKPYVCNTCNKKFTQRSTLTIHQRYHSGERPYVCKICSKGFVSKGVLDMHIKHCSLISEN